MADLTSTPTPDERQDQRHLDRLACPVCRQPLALATSALRCTACQRCYPIVDGIPVLIAERAS